MKVFVVVLIGLTSLLASLFFFTDRQTATPAIPLADSVRSPEGELAGFKVPEGFVVELVASERDGVIKPIDLTFDDAGRLWTQTAQMYPLDPVMDIRWDDLLRLMDNKEAREKHPAFKRMLDLYQGRTKGLDKILVLSDLYGGKSAKVSVWADGLAIPMSILPYKDGAYVAQGSELFFLKDANNDGKADERVPLLTGFGFTDTHTMAHVLIRGPGDWIHFSQGALNKGEVSSLKSGATLPVNYSKIARFSLDGSKLELVNAGLNNIWGFQLRHNGQWYGTEANDLGYSIVPMEPGTAYPGIGNERLRDYQPWMPELHKFRVGGTGISGLAFADDISGSFPAQWKDVAFLANPITSTINAVRIVRNADGTVSAEHLPDLLSSEDKFFRPVNMEFGPDGCLYIADWYNKIISHNEIPTSHPDRDKTHGRIWRIRHVSQQPRPVPDLTKARAKDLPDYLKSPSIWAKRAAWHQLSDRPAKETGKLAPAIVKLAGDASLDEITRILALWSLEGIKHYDDKLMNALLSSPADNLRREAARSLTSFGLSPAAMATALQPLIEDVNPMVRSQVLRTIAEFGKADAGLIGILVQACKPEIPGNTMGGAYERRFERYLALKALEEFPTELLSYLNGAGKAQPAANRLWAIQALPTQQKEKMFLDIWPSANISRLDESGFIMAAQMLKNRDIYATLQPLISNPSQATYYVDLALKNQQRTQSAELSSLLEQPVSHLLKSREEADRKLALDAIGRLKIGGSAQAVAALVDGNQSPEIVKLALRALGNDPKGSREAFVRAAGNEALDLGLRLEALNTLAQADAAAAGRIAGGWATSFSEEQQKTLVKGLSATKEGSALLTGLFDKKQLSADAFDLASAERIHNAIPSDRTATALLETVKDRVEREKQEFEGKLHKYMAIAEAKKGDPVKGQALFQVCLMCHRVGDKGHDIAPALDGSATRENEALLTAILDPDAAVEGGYATYRLVKKDNSTLEGYLYQKEDRGTTIAFMGGAKVFVPSSDIKSEGFLGGRSFMPKGLIDAYSDNQVADLLAYIRTLK